MSELKITVGELVSLLNGSHARLEDAIFEKFGVHVTHEELEKMSKGMDMKDMNPKPKAKIFYDFMLTIIEQKLNDKETN